MQKMVDRRGGRREGSTGNDERGRSVENFVEREGG